MKPQKWKSQLVQPKSLIYELQIFQVPFELQIIGRVKISSELK